MNLRTITLWVAYDPKWKHIVASKPTKKALIERCHIPENCVVVKMKGHYVQSPPVTR